MKKSEIFHGILDKVCEVCEVRKDCVINGSKIQAVVDARILTVQYLRRIGLSSDDIALIVMREINGDPKYCPPLAQLKMKAKAIDKTFNSYSARCLQSYAFCLMSKDITDFCHEQYRDLYLSWMKELPNRK